MVVKGRGLPQRGLLSGLQRPEPSRSMRGRAKVEGARMDRLPLEGIKVLDLSRVLAGPWATMTLADLGADVWKIENIKGGDDTRAWSVPSYKGVSTYYLCANRGK